MALNITAEDVGNDSTRQAPTTKQGAAANASKAPAPDKLLFQLPQQIRSTLDAVLPADSAPPAEIIHACELRIDAARTVQKAIENYGSETLFRYAGPAVRLAHRTRSWEHIEDPSTGKPFRGFRPWCTYVGISTSQAYRMLSVEPVMDALRPLNPGALTTKQVDILAPVLSQHDAARCRKVWETAQKLGGTDPKTLLKARNSLELAITDPEDGQEGTSSGDGRTPVVRFQPGRYDRESVRTAVRSDPEFARLLARDILDELQALDSAPAEGDD